MDVFDTTAVTAAIDTALLPTVHSSHERGWITSAVEVACLDAQGRLTGRPVSDLLGGKVRDSVPFAAYLFYQWGEPAALPNLDHSWDTHYPWNSGDDVIVPGALELRDGAVKVPTGPGLGVELDHDALDRLHRRYLDSGRRGRDDTGYIRRFHPEYERRLPRW